MPWCTQPSLDLPQDLNRLNIDHSRKYVSPCMPGGVSLELGASEQEHTLKRS